jgi:drug/metabolite transporter (DMT)-like permease
MPKLGQRRARTTRRPLLQQYGIYVEMADRISGRRMLANTFFLTLNTAVFTVFGVLWETKPSGSFAWLTFPLVALLIQCGSWYWILRSYRQLNSAKYTVIGALEERLPASPYWRAEWKVLGRATTAHDIFH